MHKAFILSLGHEAHQLLDNDAYIKALRSQPWYIYAITKYGIAAEREYAGMCQAIGRIQDPYHRRVAQRLSLDNVVDMAGILTKRLCGVTWKRQIPLEYANNDYVLYQQGDVSTHIAEPISGSVRSITIQEIQEFAFLSSIEKMRPKIDGTYFRSEGGDLVGSFVVPKSMVKEAEFAQGKFYVISPAIDKPFSQFGFDFVPHLWQKQSPPSQEGLILYIGGQECKIKKNPTIEVTIINGHYSNYAVVGAPRVLRPIIAEVCWYDGQLYYLRERYGKFPSDLVKLHAMASLAMLPEILVVEEKTPLMIYQLAKNKLKNMELTSSTLYATEDHIIFNFADNAIFCLPKVDSIEAAVSWIEKGYNHNGHELKPYCSMHTPMTRNYSAFEATLPYRRAVKMSFDTTDGLALFKDGKKAWDFIGGRIEKDETPIIALLREVKEESGYIIQEDDCKFVTRVYSVTTTCIFETFIYAYCGSYDDFAQQFKYYNPKAIVVPWIGRYMEVFSGVSVRPFRLHPAEDEYRSVTLPGSVMISPFVFNQYVAWYDVIPNMLSQTSVSAPRDHPPDIAGIQVRGNVVTINYRKINIGVRVGLFVRSLPQKTTITSLLPMPWGISKHFLQMYAPFFWF